MSGADGGKVTLQQQQGAEVPLLAPPPGQAAEGGGGQQRHEGVAVAAAVRVVVASLLRDPVLAVRRAVGEEGRAVELEAEEAGGGGTVSALLLHIGPEGLSAPLSVPTSSTSDLHVDPHTGPEAARPGAPVPAAGAGQQRLGEVAAAAAAELDSPGPPVSPFPFLPSLAHSLDDSVDCVLHPNPFPSFLSSPSA